MKKLLIGLLVLLTGGVLAMRRLSLILVFPLILTACVELEPAAAAGAPASLKEAAALTRLQIGTNTDRPVGSYEGTYGATISREFNALSTTASMWMIVHPSRDRWDFSFLDEVVGFAQRNNLRVIGTPILWGAEGDSPEGRGIVSTCLAVSACQGITFWGFTDRHNWWIDEMGYTDEQPLLFDAEYRRKPAYDGVLGALGGQ